MRGLELKDPRAAPGSGWQAGGRRMGLEPGWDSTQPGGGTCRLAPSWVLPVGNPRSATSIPGTASPAGSGRVCPEATSNHRIFQKSRLLLQALFKHGAPRTHGSPASQQLYTTQGRG